MTGNLYRRLDVAPALVLIALLALGKVNGWMDLKTQLGRRYLTIALVFTSALCCALFALCKRMPGLSVVSAETRKKLIVGAFSAAIVGFISYIL